MASDGPRTTVRSLAGLLRDRRDGGSAVAFDTGDEHTWAAFVADVHALGGRLATAPERRWLVQTEDAYAFAVTLFAVAHTGGVVILPPNAQPGTLARIAGEVDGFIADVPEVIAAGDRRAAIAPLGHPDAGWRPPGDLDADAPFVEFHTSGTTGDSRRVPKRLRHLDLEVALLESVFGAAVGAARIYATVSHQHIYGTLFRVLWPLAAQRAFSRRPFLYGGALAALSAGDAALVSSPVQLRAMAEAHALGGMRPLAVFSSGAPLDENTAIAVAEATGVAVTEVFGSTETGGVAWRRRPRGGDLPWHLLPGIEAAADADGNLSVTSALVSVGQAECGERGWHRFVMGDRAEVLPDGTFFLHGRADRIVKVGAKRLSLPEMESEIARSPLVEEAALVALPRRFGLRVGAVVVLSAAGRDRLQADGRASLVRRLAESLAPYFDRVLLPRAWRLVARLPRNPQGKITDADLRALFARSAPARARSEARPPAAPPSPVTAPQVLDEHRQNGRLHRRCVVPRDLAYFAGHFDGMPIVAGVVQLAWVVGAVGELLGATPAVTAVEALKFKRPLRPEDTFELEVVLDAGGAGARFRFCRAVEEISSGRIKLG